MANARRAKSVNGDGCGQLRSDGPWEWRISLDEGRMLSAYGKTRAEAKSKCRTKVKQAAAGIDVKAAKQSLGTYLETWLEDVVKPQLAPKTYASYRDTVHKHITPALVHIELGNLTAAHVQGLLRAKEREGVLSSRQSHISAPCSASPSTER